MPGRTLVVTNDFPPRAGGIQAFVENLVTRQPPESVVVFAADWHGSAAFDRQQPFPVIRHTRTVMVPEPSVVRRASEILRSERCDRVLFGAAAPLGLMGGNLRRAGAARLVALTHGHEAGWAVIPGARSLLRRIGELTDTITYLGEYTRSRIAAAITPAAAARMRRLVPGVDATTFNPEGRRRDAVRERLGLAGRPVVVCVSRLMRRKGQDVLVRALPAIRHAVPGAALLLVGGGPYRKHLVRLVADMGLSDAVRITGSVPWEDLPDYYAAGDVFAMPCRTRRLGTEFEGLGIVYLEASAMQLPAVAGNSGGAPDAILPGETGEVIDGRSTAAVAQTVGRLLADAPLARAMGVRGRRWVTDDWSWANSAARMALLLDGADPDRA